jgi:hypothetical protein
MAFTAHIIQNGEITLTECDEMLEDIPEMNPNRPGYDAAHRLLGSGPEHVALWDDVQVPAGAAICQLCHERYCS